MSDQVAVLIVSPERRALLVVRMRGALHYTVPIGPQLPGQSDAECLLETLTNALSVVDVTSEHIGAQTVGDNQVKLYLITSVLWFYPAPTVGGLAWVNTTTEPTFDPLDPLVTDTVLPLLKARGLVD